MMRILSWVLRVFVFFALFAFALNNQQDVEIHWFFGRNWHAPMVIVVLIVFALGCAFGVLAMVPAWWRQMREAQREAQKILQQDRPSAVNTPYPPDGL